MSKGSVIIDVAVDKGGSIELLRHMFNQYKKNMMYCLMQ
ncbi:MULTISPECIES: hypothetical protein [Virgibacillus]|nr:hypothetical protein [Virgibacillus sp.]